MTPTEVVPSIFLLDLGLSKAYLWDRDDGITLIDTGVAGSERAVANAVREIGRQMTEIDEIVLTHFHDDHRGSALALVGLTGATLIAHELDAPVIEGREIRSPPNLTDEERPFAEKVIPLVPPAPACPVGNRVQDGDELRGGATVVHVPGHTPGSIAVLARSLGVLFTGDTIASVNGRPILGPFNVDREQAKASVRRQARLEFEVACFGHGQPLVGSASTAIAEMAARL